MPETARRRVTDPTDAAWALLAPSPEKRHDRGRPPRWPRRLVADAAFHPLRSGCPRRLPPRDHPLSRSDPPEGCRTVPAYVERTRGPAGAKLRTFEEAVLGTEARVFGNVAARGATEDEADVNRGVEMLPRVQDEGAWRIASRAWDTEGPSRRTPERPVGGAALGRPGKRRIPAPVIGLRSVLKGSLVRLDVSPA